jgi:hypothetical protein
MGIEVQIPLVDADRFAAWKEALPSLGVPSPVRPEFGGMLEAAFRPARSFHALALGPLLLSRLGAIAQPQDMALHVSLQGDFSDHVPAIAFPHLFIHPSQRHRNRPDSAMSRVMSKGLVHIHNDAEPLDSQEAPVKRTEFRMFRIIANSDYDSSVQLERGYISDLIAVQILGSASSSSCDHCRALFRSYAGGVEELAMKLGPEFHQLLHSNFFESSGDPRDEELLRHLPVFRSWSKVRQAVQASQLSPSLDGQFRQLRSRHVETLLNHLGTDHRLDTSVIASATDPDLLAMLKLCESMGPEIGDSVRVTVRRIEVYGMFCEYETHQILVLIPEVSWTSCFCSCEQVADIGDEFDVKILNIDKVRNRIAGSIRALYPDNNPWSGAWQLNVGDLVEATVVRWVEQADRCNDAGGYLLALRPGAFVMLCDIPAGTLKPGEKRVVRVVSMDATRGKVEVTLDT